MTTTVPAGAALSRGFKGAARRIADIDLPRLGATIGVGEDEIHAFMDVEAAGSGFDKRRRPKMLFEPHVFYRELGAGAKRNAAVKAGLAYPKWGAKPYPADSYPRLEKAMAIDPAKALRGASWGLTQILASNHREAGFASAEAMVLAFMEDEAAHLEATIKLLKAWKIDDDLRAHRWVEVARVWNGPAHAKHDYAGRMKRAFAKWSKIRDTAFAPESAPAPPAKSAPADDLQSEATVARVQKLLYDLGYTEVGSMKPDGTFDGKFGKLTKAAILAFRLDNDLPLTDAIDDGLIIALAKAKPRALPRNDAKPEEVRSQVPEVRTSWLTKVGAFFTGILALVGSFVDGVLGNLGAAADYIQPVRDMLWDVPGWVWMLLIAGVALALFLVARHGEARGVAAFQSGERR